MSLVTAALSQLMVLPVMVDDRMIMLLLDQNSIIN
jgi:hypothetical protein